MENAPNRDKNFKKKKEILVPDKELRIRRALQKHWKLQDNGARPSKF